MNPLTVVFAGLALWAGSIAAPQQGPMPIPPDGPDPAGTITFVALSYHDVRDDVQGALDADPYAVSTARLVEQFEWLAENGYTPVSVDDLLAARSGTRALPERPVVLTFDDGLRSVYTRVFPLLELFGYPAVVAPVGAWIDAPDGWSIPYDGARTLTRNDLVTWDQLREMQASGLVEVATHSYDMHRGVIANPFGNEQAAAVTRTYDTGTRSYESEGAYRGRIGSDLAQAARRIEEELGRAPRVVVWPYGEFSGVTQEIARGVGLEVSLGLHSGDQPADELQGVARYLVHGNPALPDFAWFIEHSSGALSPERVVQVDLDYVYDEDPEQMERNLDALVDRIHRLRITTVYLQAFADPTADGAARELYFPNRHLPVRADLFNRVSWQLRTRAEVQVFAWLPVLAFELPDPELNDALSVKRWVDGRLEPSRPDYRRLSPYEPRAREIIVEIYEDLGRAAPIDGILFHDDAYLSDREDATLYGDGRLPTPQEKTHTLIEFTHELKAAAEQHRRSLRTARNLYARVVVDPRAQAWFAQSLPAFLEAYDWTALMAMPLMEEAGDPERWLRDLVDVVAAHEGGLDRTLFELQSVDWRTDEPVPASRMARWMRLLQRRGAIHFGYYPDDFILGRPELDLIRPAFSVERHPFVRR